MKTKSKSQKNERRERITTPVGVAVYPYISKPDTKFDDEGKYKCRLRIAEEDAEELVAKLQEEYASAYREECNRQGTKKLKVQNKPWRNAVDEDGKETGEIEFSFSSTASGVNKETKEVWTRKIPVFDARRNPINTSKVIIGSGSELKIAFFISPYYNKMNGFGISLRFVGVQVIKLVEGGGTSPEAMGFGEEEGWEGDEEVSDSTDDEVEEVAEDADEELDLTDDDEDDEDDDGGAEVEEPVAKKGKRSDRFGLDASIAKLNAKGKAKTKPKPKPKGKAKR